MKCQRRCWRYCEWRWQRSFCNNPRRVIVLEATGVCCGWREGTVVEWMALGFARVDMVEKEVICVAYVEKLFVEVIVSIIGGANDIAAN